LQHERGEVIRVGHDLAGIGFGDALVAGKILQSAGEERQIVRKFGIDDVYLVEGNLGLGRGRLDLVPLAQKNGHAELQGDEFRSRLQDARLGPFREHDALGMSTQLVKNTFDEFHGIKKGAAGERRGAVDSGSSRSCVRFMPIKNKFINGGETVEFSQ
jgi:hypothetical protein